MKYLLVLFFSLKSFGGGCDDSFKPYYLTKFRAMIKNIPNGNLDEKHQKIKEMLVYLNEFKEEIRLEMDLEKEN